MNLLVLSLLSEVIFALLRDPRDMWTTKQDTRLVFHAILDQELALLIPGSPGTELFENALSIIVLRFWWSLSTTTTFFHYTKSVNEVHFIYGGLLYLRMFTWFCNEARSHRAKGRAERKVANWWHPLNNNIFLQYAWYELWVSAPLDMFGAKSIEMSSCVLLTGCS